MTRNVLPALTVSIFSSIAWLIALLGLYLARDISRLWFITVHYALDILIFAVLFGAYFKYVGHYTPFTTMAIAMASLFVIELVFWKFVYTGELWFLNFVDWIVPAFLVASTIYFTGTFFE